MDREKMRRSLPMRYMKHKRMLVKKNPGKGKLLNSITTIIMIFIFSMTFLILIPKILEGLTGKYGTREVDLKEFKLLNNYNLLLH